LRKRFGWTRKLQEFPKEKHLGGLIPLINMPKNGEGIVRYIWAGRGIINRLLGMGIRPGAKVKVLENSMYGVVILINGTKIGLCPRLASRIYVEQAW